MYGHQIHIRERFCIHFLRIIVFTARPQDMLSLGVWTLQICGFGLGPNFLRNADFEPIVAEFSRYADSLQILCGFYHTELLHAHTCFPGTKNLVT